MDRISSISASRFSAQTDRIIMGRDGGGLSTSDMGQDQTESDRISF
uniref:Uncharacterized protein n=1 Tax=Rhizophora mucronata TaxID=61149 RepID=A0A2P2JJL2_RHIMU